MKESFGKKSLVIGVICLLMLMTISSLVLNGVGMAGVNTVICNQTTVENQQQTELIIDGPTHGIVGEPLNYYFLLTGQEGWGFFLYVDWGDGTDTGWIGPFESGIEKTHAWYESGNYTIDAWARDIYSGYYWATLTVAITENHPPGKPEITGPSGTPAIKSSLSGVPIIKSLSGAKPLSRLLPRPLLKPGTYNYTFTSIDPDGDDLYYYIDWSDGTNSNWIGLYPSGETITRNHTWYNVGCYTVRARAKDIYGAIGDWGTIPIIIS